MKWAISLFVLLFALWLLASGHYTPLLITFGVVSCLGVVVLSRRMGIVDAEGHPVHLTPRAIRYWLWLAWVIGKANVDVARRILNPKSCTSPPPCCACAPASGPGWAAPPMPIR